MGEDEGAPLRLWREKCGEVEPQDLSANLIVQLGTATESLNRHWYERNTGQVVVGVQSRVQHPVVRWMAATLDGVVEATGAVFEAKFMLPWSFSEEGAAEKYMPQLQHNMWVTNAKLWCSRALPGVANGSRSAFRPTRFTSISFLRPSRNSGAASRVASLLASSVSSRRDRGSRPCGLLI